MALLVLAVLALAFGSRIKRRPKRPATPAPAPEPEAPRPAGDPALRRRLRSIEARYELAWKTAMRRDLSARNALEALTPELDALRRAVSTGPEGDEAEALSPRLQRLEARIEALLGPATPEARPGPDLTGPGSPQTEGADMGLPDILATVHEMFLPEAEAKGLRLDYVPTSARPELPPLAMMRIAANLVSNAVKFTDHGRILLGVRRRASGVRVEVHDTGAGLDAAAFRRASARSVRLAGSEGAQGGQGLGLAVVMDLARRHDLQVTVSDRPGGGTSIGVLIPGPRGSWAADAPGPARRRAGGRLG
ncbi:HAMP domain-containing histidine kinase [Roseivivax sp. GX 12232]|uniref:sensor histidine kinase n=1 Tax=Roseivivax sp. GX 12232 TaxID=2900547 RepID=UPI001E372ADA|nr:HAMP domain-containing sensor histidine kinase [Roseivivax sp. GX 12232]MCE0506678.1 HAMP domain-containing histidine kinase [Roseivivax sp. GX 12232]